MERWTFDSVFSGTMDQQTWKVSHLLSGIRKNFTAAERQYAQAICENNPEDAEDALNELAKIREFSTTFNARPELAEVKAYADKLERQRSKDSLHAFLIKELGLDDTRKS